MTKQRYSRFLYGQGYRGYCMRLCYIIPMLDLSTNWGHLFKKGDPQLIGAKLALNFRYLAFSLCKKQKAAVWFYGYLRLNLSIIKFALGFFMQTKCYVLLCIYFIDIDLCCF